MPNRLTNAGSPLSLAGAGLVAALSGVSVSLTGTGQISLTPASAFQYACISYPITDPEPITDGDLMPRGMTVSELAEAARQFTGGDTSHMLDI